MKNIKELEAEIAKHNELYYNQDSPVISDPEYDALRRDLENLCPTSTVLDDVGDYTFGEKFTHEKIMGSLSKCHSAAEIIERFCGHEIVLMPKIDGCSLSSHFKGGGLELAATRGDGTIGENVTSNARVIVNMPDNITDLGYIEIRGEAYIAKQDFYGVMDQPGYGSKPNGLANPRNAAAGSLRQKDESITKDRMVRFVAYELIGASFTSHSEKLDYIKQLGFETPPYEVIVCDTEATIQEAIDRCKELDTTLPYETDGIVVRMNNQAKFDSLGYSGKCPKGALAYKFETVKANTKILDIEWSTSRTGRLCPVAIIVPTRISGSIITRITLNNSDWIKKADVAIDDEILFEKANEIIPKLVSVLSRAPDRNNLNYPPSCPSCGGEIVNDYCYNKQCPAQFMASIIHIIDKLKIRGIAEGTVEKLITTSLIKKPYEIFDLTHDKLISIGFGDRSSENIISAITNVKATKVQILACLGIDGWGERMFENVTNDTISLDDIISGNISAEHLATVPGVGITRADALMSGIRENQELLNGLLERVTIMKEVERGTALKGLSFCVTGVLSKGREEIHTDIKNAGGTVKSSVSSKLDYLVVGEDAGSKLKKANTLGVKVISEDDLNEMIN